MNSRPDLSEYRLEYQHLIEALQSLQLAVNNDRGEAVISCAPFLYLEKVFYVYVSMLAEHTSNLLRNKQASILLVEPEAEAANIFARRRLSYQCRVEEINRNADAYQQVLNQMQTRFGEIVGLLRTLPDFRLLALHPQSGKYVAGFGKAFDIDAASGDMTPKIR